MTTNSNDLKRRIQDLNATMREETLEQAVQARIDTLMPLWDFIRGYAMDDLVWPIIARDNVDLLQTLLEEGDFFLSPYMRHENMNILSWAIHHDANNIIAFLHEENDLFIDKLYGYKLTNEGSRWSIDKGPLDVIKQNHSYIYLLKHYLKTNLDTKSAQSIIIFLESQNKTDDVIDILNLPTVNANRIIVSKMVVRDNFGHKKYTADLNILQAHILYKNWKTAQLYFDTGLFEMTARTNDTKGDAYKRYGTVQSTINSMNKEAFKNNPGAQSLRNAINAKAKEEKRALRTQHKTVGFLKR